MTLNNYTEGDLEKIKALSIFSYGCIGKEVGESGTPHLQGYLQLKKQSRIASVTKAIKDAVGKAPHTEPAKGNHAQNLEYCSKDGDVEEWGEPRTQGKRMDLESAYKDARSDMRMIDVADRNKSAFIRYHRGIERVRQLHNEEKAEDFRFVETVVHSGPTGCGKTRNAMTVAEGERKPYKIQGDQLKWWDGYEGQDVIVIDEYANNVPITVMLGLLDGYKLRLPVKGGFTYARWTKVQITTNLKRDQLHDQAKDEHREALWRRITLWKSYWSSEDNPWLKAAESSTPAQRREPVKDSVLGRRKGPVLDEMEEESHPDKKFRYNDDFIW